MQAAKQLSRADLQLLLTAKEKEEAEAEEASRAGASKFPGHCLFSFPSFFHLRLMCFCQVDSVYGFIPQ